MFYDGVRQEDIDINITNQNVNENTNMNMNMNNNMMGGTFTSSSMASPIIEPGRERVVNRTFVHEVPHLCPFM